MQYKKATLETLAGGAVAELFARELDTVTKNIADINTAAKASRTITLQVTIKPTEDREMAAVDVKCASKCPSVKPAATSMFFGKEGGKPMAYTHDPRQDDLFHERDNVVGLKGEEVSNA